MSDPTVVDADVRRRDRRLFVSFGITAILIAIAVTCVSRFTPSFPAMSGAVVATPSLRAEYERLKSTSEWLEALMAGLLAGASVLLAATIWSRRARGESERSWNRKLTALTAVTLVLAGYPLINWAIRLVPITPMPGLVWWIVLCSGAALVVALCVLIPWALLTSGPQE
jgi:hypothetical protein